MLLSIGNVCVQTAPSVFNGCKASLTNCHDFEADVRLWLGEVQKEMCGNFQVEGCQAGQYPTSHRRLFGLRVPHGATVDDVAKQILGYQNELDAVVACCASYARSEVLILKH